MDPCATPSSLTIHGLEQAIVALPYQLGYHPRRSLVLTCLASRPPGGGTGSVPAGERVSLTARVDLPEGGEHAAFAAALDPALRRPETAAVIIVVFADGPVGRLETSALLAAVTARARRRGVSVRAAAHVSGQCWRQATPDGSGAGPWHPLPHPRDVPAVAEYVVAGRAPAPDRRGVERLLRPRDTALAARVSDALRDRRAYGSPGEVAEVTASHAGRVAAVFGQLLSGPETRPSPGPADLARCASSLHHVPWRDTLLSRMTGVDRGSGTVRAPWRRAVQRHVAGDLVLDRVSAERIAAAAAYAPSPWAAPWLTVTGLVAWHAGDGALANIAVEAALRADPQYSLAGLLDSIVRNAVPPPPRPSLRPSGPGACCV